MNPTCVPKRDSKLGLYICTRDFDIHCKSYVMPDLLTNCPNYSWFYLLFLFLGWFNPLLRYSSVNNSVSNNSPYICHFSRITYMTCYMYQKRVKITWPNIDATSWLLPLDIEWQWTRTVTPLFGQYCSLHYFLHQTKALIIITNLCITSM